ncbi:hypothetical protein [Thiothrix subterranea]|uniref:Uncharacterized protein n=1 Tax=Thiothrix subterranea TaxID=2735563 RepID=A0AA51R5W0_9GAMM|nr:hypothetical protein [Thiothrix subterranea]MDQ5766918.1 hypothetical protein [Thiothrix subterranea]WML88220.1 hypothetical protein RCG00_07545 [Thiothrix subterranea]
MSGKYEGLHNDKQFGMSPVGRLIRDAWVFGLLPDTEQCAGWSAGMLQNLYEKVHAEWMKYGHLPSRLPPELQQRHSELHSHAISEAKAKGWDAELGEGD